MSGGIRPSIRGFWTDIGRHGIVYLAAEAGARGGIYVLFVWLASQAAVAEFGLLNVFVSLLTLSGVAVGLGLPDALMRFHFSREDFRPVLGLAMLLPVFLSIALLMLVAPLRHVAGAALNIPPYLVVAVVAAAPLIAVRQSWLAVLRARREPGPYLLFRVAEPLVFGCAILVIAIRSASFGHEVTVPAYVAAVLATALMGMAGAFRLGLRVSVEPMLRVLRFSLPLVLHSLAMTGLAVFDQIVLQQLMGAEATGTYAFAYRFGMAMQLLVFGMTAAWAPLLIEHIQAGSAASLRSSAVTAFRILVISAAVLSWALPPVAAWIGGERFAAALPLIPLVVYAYLWTGFYGLAMAYVYVGEGSFRLATISGAAFVLNVVLNYVTIPRWGATGAAVTTVAAYVFLVLLTWRAVTKHDSPLPWGSFLRETLFAGPLILGAAWFYG